MMYFVYGFFATILWMVVVAFFGNKVTATDWLLGHLAGIASEILDDLPLWWIIVVLVFVLWPLLPLVLVYVVIDYYIRKWFGAL